MLALLQQNVLTLSSRLFKSISGTFEAPDVSGGSGLNVPVCRSSQKINTNIFYLWELPFFVTLLDPDGSVSLRPNDLCRRLRFRLVLLLFIYLWRQIELWGPESSAPAVFQALNDTQLHLIHTSVCEPLFSPRTASSACAVMFWFLLEAVQL